MGFLDGLRVLDCSDERGLAAGRLLADFGADVIQVEPPGGSTARHMPPVSHGKSLFWATYAANKRGMTCDLDSTEGQERIRDLAAASDFFIESGDTGQFDRRELGWERLRTVNPRLVYVSISAFGRSGPKAHWAATDLTVWASGGPLAYNLDATGRPLRISVPQSFLHASADAAAGALVAHHARKRSGLGQFVEVSAQASLGLCTLAANLIAVTGDAEPDWMPKVDAGVTIDQSGSGSRTRRSKWPVRDGFVELHLAMGPAVGAFTNAFFAWMRHEGELPDEEIAAWDWRLLPEEVAAGRVDSEQMERARGYVGRFLEARTKREVTEAALARKLLSVGVADTSDLATSEHFAARGFLVAIPGRGDTGDTMPGPVARTSVDSCSWRHPAPEPDPATTTGWNEQRPRPTHPAVPSPRAQPALAGLRVADLSWVVAGPVMGRALADFGATVVRVESGTKVETARLMPPFYGAEPGPENSALYLNCNAGKLGLAVDLGTEQGRDTVREMARWADVLVESFTPGRMEGWGLGYESLARENPGLIVLSSSLMGNFGPLSRLAGFGNIGAAMSGFQYLVGWPDQPPLGPFGPYTDYIGPRMGLVALLSALEWRSRTGQGCYLDLSQVECGAWFLAPQIAAYLADGTVTERRGNRDDLFVPHGVYPCRAAGPARADHVAVVVRDDRDFAVLTEVMGRPELAADPRYGTAGNRRAHEEELDAILASWTAGLDAAEVERLCQEVGVPAHRASKSADFVSDPQLAHRNHLVKLAHPIHGQIIVEGPRYRLSDTPGRVERAAPVIGQDNEEVLVSVLGLDPERVRVLEKTGVLR